MKRTETIGVSAPRMLGWGKGIFFIICIVVMLSLAVYKQYLFHWNQRDLPIYYTLNKSPPNLERESNCSIRMIGLLEPNRLASTSKKVCTFGDFDDYFSRIGQYYGTGVWTTVPKASPQHQFLPDMCTLSPPISLEMCLRQKGIQKILITGDSNGLFLHNSLDSVMSLSKQVTLCPLLRATGSAGDAGKYLEYFKVPDVPDDGKLNAVENGYCCTQQCTLRNGTSVALEFIALRHFLDIGITISPSMKKGHFFQRNYMASSKLEYMLRYYFPFHGFPDLWIVSPGFHHESWSSSLEKFELDITYMLGLLSLYLPRATHVVFLSAHRECEAKFPPEVARDFKRLWNTTRNLRTVAINQIYYRILRPEVERNRNYHVFIDATKLSCPVMCKWHRDGAHFVDEWYTLMNHYILRSLCNG